jgi:DNA-3-methyladenine glycosylase II
MQRLTFSLAPVPPFRLDLTAWALRRRSVNATDSWNGEVYSRVVDIDGVGVFLRITQSGRVRSPRLHVNAVAERIPSNGKATIIDAVQKLLGVRVNMTAFYRFAKKDAQLHELCRRFLGLKPPRFPSVFEGVVNGIACQQLSLHVGLTLLNRVAASVGIPFETTSGTRFAFPSPKDLDRLSIRAFRQLGFSSNKGLALKRLAAEVLRGTFDPAKLAHLENRQAVERLLQLRGVGRWTAEYVLLRGLGRTDVFPGDDVGARNNLAKWLDLKDALDYNSVNRALAKWRPYAGLLYFHLLLDNLASTPSSEFNSFTTA